MKLPKFILLIIFIFGISFVLIGGCGSGSSSGSDEGEVSCEEFGDIFCERAMMCLATLTLQRCNEELANNGIFFCEIEDKTFTEECLIDFSELGCLEVLDALFEGFFPGSCNV